MELDLTGDQELLRETAAKFMDASCPLDVVRQLGASETGLPANYMHDAAELGWFSLLVPEEDGGGSVSGYGLRDAAILAEERGRRLQPGPFVPMNIVASALGCWGLRQPEGEGPAGDHERGCRCHVGGGERRGRVAARTLACRCPPPRGGSYFPGAPVWSKTPVWPIGSWWRRRALTGQYQFLVPSSGAGVSDHATSGARHHPALRVRSTSTVSKLDDDALVGDAGNATADLERQLQLALVLLVAETVGAIDALFEMTRQYAIDRIAFGRPIGSFQAVKHQLADMSLSVEAGKSIATAATRAVQAGAERWQ